MQRESQAERASGAGKASEQSLAKRAGPGELESGGLAELSNSDIFELRSANSEGVMLESA